MAKTRNGQVMSNNAEQAQIKSLIGHHKPNVMQLKNSVAKQQQGIKFVEKELDLIKSYDESLFTKNEGYAYETEESYLKFIKELKIESMELSLVIAKEKYEIDLRSYELESARLRILESGQLYGGMSEEEILKH